MNASLRRIVLGAALAALVTACGGGGPGGGDGTPVTGETHVEVKSGTAAAPIAIQPGRYKVAWRIASSCAGVAVRITDPAGTELYKKTSRIKSFSSIASSLPGGPVIIEQTDASCTEWTITLDKIG
jgi:hypothetical protein